MSEPHNTDPPTSLFEPMMVSQNPNGPGHRRSLQVSRRTVGLMGVAALAVVFGTGAAIMNVAGTRLRPYRRLGERLLALHGNAAGLASLGEGQLSGVTPVAQYEELKEHFKHQTVQSWLEHDEEELLQAVRAASLAEYERGELTSCNGWLLSRTEAALCACVAVASQSHA